MPVIEGFTERAARGAGGAIEGFQPRITGELRPPTGSRSALGFANDTVVTGLNSALGIGKAISDFVSVDNPVSRGLQWLIDEGEQTYTPQTRASREEVFRAIDAGGWDAVRGVGEFVLTSPVQAVAMAAGNFGPFGVGIKGARGLAAAAGAGTAGVRAAGIGAASAMGGAAAGGDAAGDAYEQVMRSPNVDPAVREELARQAAREASAVPAVIGALTPFLPGSAESQLARGLGITRASIPRAAASEFGQEFIEEGATKLSANLAAQQYDPAIDASRGVLGSALLGGVLGAGTGATVAYINNRGVQADLLRRDAAIEAQLREREAQLREREAQREAQLAPILGRIRPDSGVGTQDLINQQLGISPALADKEIERQRKQREADILAAFNEPSGVRVPGADGQERELSAYERTLQQQGLTPAQVVPDAAPAAAPSKVFSAEEQELISMGVAPNGKALELLSEIKAAGLPMDSLEPVITAMAERKNGQAKKLLAQAIIEARKPAPAAAAPQAPTVVAPVQPPVGATAASVAEAPGVTSLPVPEVAPDVQAPQAVQGEAPAEAAVAAPAAQDAAPAAATEPVTATTPAAPTEPVVQRKRRVVDPAALRQAQAFVAPEPTEEQEAPADPNVAAWEDSKPDDAPALTALTPALQQVWAQAVAAKGEGRRINLFKVAEDILAEQGEEFTGDDTLETLNQIFGERDAAMLYDRYVDNMTEEAIANKYGQSRQNVAKVTGEGELGQKTRATKIRNAQQKFGWSDEYVQQLAARLSPAQTETEAAPTSGRTKVDLEATESAFGADTAPEMGGRDPSLREAGFSTSASLGGSVSNWRDSGELAGRTNITQADQAKLDALYARRAAAEEAGNDSEVESADAEISQVETKYLSPGEVAVKFTQRSIDLRDRAAKRRQQIEQARAAGKDAVSVNNKLVPVAELEAQEAELEQKAQEALEKAEAVLQRGAVRKAKGAEPKTEKPKVRRVKKDEAKAPTAPAVEQTTILTTAEQAARAWDQATNTIPGAPKWADLTPAQQREFVGYGENNWTRQDVVTMLQRAAPAPAAQDRDARDSANSTSQRERELRAKSRDKEQPGDVMLATTGKFVSFEDALEAARAAVASGALRPDAPFQYNAVLDIAPRDWNRMVQAMTGPRAMRSPGFTSVDMDGRRFTGQPVTLDSLMAYDGVARAILHMTGNGVGDAIDAVQAWYVTNDQVGWDAIFANIDGKPSVVFSADALQSRSRAVFSFAHEVGHAIDETHTGNFTFSSEPELNLSLGRNGVRPMGPVAIELLDHYQTGDSALSQLLEYPLDLQGESGRSASRIREELFAQLWAFSSLADGMQFLRDNLPASAAFMESVHAQVRQTYASGQAGEVQGAQPGQVQDGRQGEGISGPRAARQTQADLSRLPAATPPSNPEQRKAKAERDEKTIELRKRLSVLKQLKECLGR